MSDWKEHKLGDVIKFGNGKIRPNSVGMIPVFGGNGILDYCNESNYDNETIIIGRVGAYCGAVYYENKPIWVSDNALAAKPKEKFHAKFIYYFLKNLGLNQFAEGSSHPLVTQTLLNSIDIYITEDIEEQRTIASILSSLDNKIDLLNLKNKTLEQLAETLFREWFIEKKDSSEITTLSEFAINVRENAKVEDLKNYDKYVGLEHLPRKCIALSYWGIPTDLASNKSIFIENDILLGKLRSYFHKVVFAPIRGVCSTDILVIRPKRKEWFSYCLLGFFNKELVDYSDLLSGGTRMPRTSWEIISGFQIPRPNYKKIEDFDKIVRPMTMKITYNINQIHVLEKLRDVLLPQLMNGEIKIKSK
jgi:type I restriction enzyme, S subunit